MSAPTSKQDVSLIKVNPSLPQTSDSPDDDTAYAMSAVNRMVSLYLYISRRTDQRGFDYDVMTNFRLISASGHPSDPATNTPASTHPTVTWQLEVKPHHTNLNNVMHGGCASVVFDMGTVTALCPIQKPGYWDFMAGVTRSLNVSYLRAVPVGTTVVIRSRVVQHGRTMCLLEGRMESLDGRITYATCEHHKVHVPTKPEHLRWREEMDKDEGVAKDVREGRAKL